MGSEMCIRDSGDGRRGTSQSHPTCEVMQVCRWFWHLLLINALTMRYCVLLAPPPIRVTCELGTDTCTYRADYEARANTS